MSARFPWRVTLVLVGTIGLFGLGGATPAHGAIPGSDAAIEVTDSPASAVEAGCGCPPFRDQVRAYQQRILEAPSLEDARELAVAPTQLAQQALGRARRLAPFSEALGTAHGTLVEYGARVENADSPAAVGREFAALVGLRATDAIPELSADADVDFAGKRSCTYTTGEIIAILLGLILGIIPGIILLILLC